MKPIFRIALMLLITTFISYQILNYRNSINDDPSVLSSKSDSISSKGINSSNFVSKGGRSTTVKHRSIYRRGAFGGIFDFYELFLESFFAPIIGSIMILIAISLLWYMERRSVKIAEIIQSAQNVCIEAPEKPILKENNHEMVCISGTTYNPNVLVEKDFGLHVENSVKINRKIEVYQMEETSKTTKRKNEASVTTYYYNPVWSSDQISSSDFHVCSYQCVNNKVVFITDDHTTQAKTVRMGEFTLIESQLEQMKKFKAYPVPMNIMETASEKIKTQIKRLKWSSTNTTVEGDYLMVRQQPKGQEIGDIRVSFEVVSCGPVTVVSEQNEDSFKPYNYKSRSFKRLARASSRNMYPNGMVEGDERKSYGEEFDRILDSVCSYLPFWSDVASMTQEDQEVNWVLEANHTKAQAFKEKEEENLLFTFLFRWRLGGWLLLLIGTRLVFEPMIVFSSKVFISQYDVDFGMWVAAFLASTSVTSIVIAVSWMAHRPYAGALMLVVPMVAMAATVSCFSS